jgi:hypothetical protein
MAIREFNIADLTEIDNGRIGEALKLEMKKVIEDCRDRPTLDKPRKIKLEMSIEPTCDPKTFDVDGIKLAFKVSSTMPTKERTNLDLGVKKDGRLFFSEHSPTNFDQTTVFDKE